RLSRSNGTYRGVMNCESKDHKGNIGQHDKHLESRTESCSSQGILVLAPSVRWRMRASECS
ncbi:MAG: hypothetical protein QF435_16465, partial [Arenicellales bacterium]|nr:hypothetical protein [Arenicellales bacterium]